MSTVPHWTGSTRLQLKGVRFFGLEIELWRIGDSAMAPKFNVVSHPNSWTKTIDQIVHRELTPSKQLYFSYWTVLRDLLKESNVVINPVEPSPQHWMGFAIGASEFRLDAAASVRDKWICVSLTLKGPNAKPHFYLLKKDKVDIEEEIGDELEWEEKQGQKQSYISLSLSETDPEDRQDWNMQHQWLCDKLEIFHRVFSPRVKALD